MAFDLQTAIYELRASLAEEGCTNGVRSIEEALMSGGTELERIMLIRQSLKELLDQGQIKGGNTRKRARRLNRRIAWSWYRPF
jgi:hypothetical protein